MKATIHALIGLMLLSNAASLAWAKGATTQIVIDGALLSSPVEISDPDIAGNFHVWNGPGVWVNDQSVHRDPANLAHSVINWAKEAASDRPEGLESYEVTLVIEGRESPGRRYVVTYEFDPATPGGYIYLPRLASNTSLIWHGVEGNWFSASEAWERMIRPVIEDARTSE